MSLAHIPPQHSHPPGREYLRIYNYTTRCSQKLGTKHKKTGKGAQDIWRNATSSTVAKKTIGPSSDRWIPETHLKGFRAWELARRQTVLQPEMGYDQFPAGHRLQVLEGAPGVMVLHTAPIPNISVKSFPPYDCKRTTNIQALDNHGHP
jgi:hypothetical protein